MMKEKKTKMRRMRMKMNSNKVKLYLRGNFLMLQRGTLIKLDEVQKYTDVKLMNYIMVLI